VQPEVSNHRAQPLAIDVRVARLEVMGGTSAAGRLLIEILYPFYREGFEDEAFGRRPVFLQTHTLLCARLEPARRRARHQTDEDEALT